MQIILNQRPQALIIEPRWATLPSPIFKIVVCEWKVNKYILGRALREGVLAERAVDAECQVCCIPSTFDVVKHNAPNGGF